MVQLYPRDPSRPSLLRPQKRATRSQVKIENIVSDSDADHSDTPSLAPPTRSRRYGYSQAQPDPLPVGSDSEHQSAVEAGCDDDESSDDDDDPDDDNEEPIVIAPPRRSQRRAAGRQVSKEPLSKLNVDEDMFADADDDSDDEDDPFSYRQLDDQEDDDDDLDTDNAANGDDQFLIEASNDYEDYISRIEGLSAYGFGDDMPPVSSSSDLEELPSPTLRRQVHFHPNPEHTAHLTQTVAPALLPSALPNADDPIHAFPGIQSDISQVSAVQGGFATSPLPPGHGTLQDDPYDSDATVISLPPEAHTTNLTSLNRAANDSEMAKVNVPAKRRRSKKSLNKVPPRGYFDIDTTKPYAILGEKARLEVFVPVTGPNRPQWLSKELLLSENGSINGDEDGVSVSGLLSEASSCHQSRRNSLELATSNDVPTDLQGLADATAVEQFEDGTFALPELGFTPGAFQLGDFVIDADDDDPENEGDLPGDMSIFVEWSDDSDSEQESPDKAVATVTESSVFKRPGSSYSQMNSANVTSFRRNADPAFAALAHNQHLLSAMPKLSIPPLTFDHGPKQGHKRKASDSPYSSPRYDGVTPVQRVIRSSKRRKTISS